MPEIVILDRVTKRFDRTVAVNELSFSVSKGELFGLIGPDGAGKTTSIRMMCGLVAPDAGRLVVVGRNPIKDHRALTQSVGYLAQRFSLYGDLTVDENIAFFAEIHGVRQYRERLDRLLDLMRLSRFRSRLADRLSGGMRQKLALACTLIHEPELVVLDEPTTGVDPVSRRELWKLLADFRAQGITMVISTPYLDEAERCTRVALLHEGRLLAMDSPEALRNTLGGTVFEVIAHPHRLAASLLQQLPGVADVQSFGERAHVRLAAGRGDTEKDLQRWLADRHVEVTSVRRILPSLEDVFIERIKTGESR